MPVTLRKTNKFLNSREWRTFLAAAQAAASYPSVVVRAVRVGQAWLAGGPPEPAAKMYGAAPASAATKSWLLDEAGLLPDPAKTLGV